MSTVYSNIKQSHDLNKIIVSMIKEFGLVDHQINLVNRFYTDGIYKIFDSSVPIVVSTEPSDNDKSLYDRVECKITFNHVNMEPPSVINFSKQKKDPIYPTEALAKRLTYASNIRADIEFKFTGYKRDSIIREYTRTMENREICTMPILVKSVRCNTYGLSPEALMLLGEDPDTPGGYYIVKGQEYFVNTTEASAPNIFKTFRGNKGDDFFAKTEFTSKDGFDNQINYRITTMLGRDKVIYIIIECGMFKEVRIPLPIFIVALGLNIPIIEILEKISYSQPSLVSIFQSCWYSFRNLLSSDNQESYARDHIVNLVAKKEKVSPITDDYYRKVVNEFERIFDNCCLTILGKTRASGLAKLDYILRMSYWVASAGSSSTNELIDNRDTSVIKRFASPAATVSKVTKNAYTKSIAGEYRDIIRNALMSQRFESIDPEKLFKTKQKDITEEFLRAFSQTINAGGTLKAKDGTAYKNQMKIGMAQHKNPLSILSQARAIDGNSFGDNAITTSSRNKEFRRNEQSLTGGICPIHSATESKNVGVKKQYAVSARVTVGVTDDDIIELLQKDDDVIKTDVMRCDPLTHALIFVNGIAIGKVENNKNILPKYNKYKREQKIPETTSIVYIESRNEINFFTDGGRLYRPVVPILEDNTIPLTEEDLDKEFSVLLEEGKIVYLTTDEAPSYRIATSFEEWVESIDSPVDKFHFIEIPAGIFSLAVITTPYLHHNQLARTVYQSSQSRQTASANLQNLYRRYDKEMYSQFYTGKATVKTIYRDLGLEEYGENINIAIMQTTSDNQEDSIIIKKGSVDCGMMNMIKWHSMRVPVDSKEKLGIDDELRSKATRIGNLDPFKDIDPNTGIARRNTIINSEPKVIVAKSTKIAETVNGVLKSETKNKSHYLSNMYEEEFIDHSNICNIDGINHVQISTTKVRPLEVGDKLSTRSGQKGIVGRICENNEMPYTLSGDKPDILFNSHGFNTRMTIGMIIEGLFAIIGSKLCTYIDATAFTKIPDYIFLKEDKSMKEWEKDLEYEYRNYPKDKRKQYIEATIAAAKEIRSQLEANDYDRHTMISGLTGEVIEGKVVMVRMFEQRLLKVVKDAFYVASDTVKYDIHNRQPAEGSKASGGLRNGEMETGNMIGHGSAFLLGEKTHLHSDGIIEHLCRCGNQAVHNYETNTTWCHQCREKTDPVPLKTTFASVLLHDRLGGVGIDYKRIPEKYKIYEFKEFEEV